MDFDRLDVQLRGLPAATTPAEQIHQAASTGIAEAAAPLPHADTIRAAFGRHDVSGIRAQVGGPAAHACTDMSAEAYAMGSRVGFRSSPDLHTAAHEAAHVVQQRAGVHLKGGVGQPGDSYEQHADAVADRVVRGESAEDLLDHVAGSAVSATGAVQRKATGSKRVVPKSAKKGKRLAVDDKPWDLGEQIVGSDHSFNRAAPWNTGTVQGQLTAKVVSKDKAFSLQGHPAQLYPTGTMSSSQMSYHLDNPLRVAFKPNRSGEFAAELVLRARFVDGHRETASIVIKARARTLTQAPAEEVEGDVTRDDEAASGVTKQWKKLYDQNRKLNKHYRQNDEDDFNRNAVFAGKDADLLVRAQRDGLRRVERDALKYEKKLPPKKTSLWWGLVEFSLNIATAGIAGTVAAKLGPRLAAAVANNKSAVNQGGEFARLGPRLNTFVKNRVKANHERLAKGVTAMVKEGIKGAMKAGIEKAHGSLEGGDGDRGGAASSDLRNEFFNSQDTALTQAQEENNKLIEDRMRYLQPLLHKSPRLAIDAIKAVRTSFQSSKADAAARQAESTTTQWFALIAQSTLGTEYARGPRAKDPAVTTTDLRDARKPGGGLPAPKDGLLDIVLHSPHPPVRVVSARVHGVSQQIADRLGQIKLEDYPIPVRIVLGSNLDRPTIITRDEAGRIRIEGDYAAVARHASLQVRPGKRVSEAQAHRGAKVVVDKVLSHPLATYGLDKKVKTDDASGRSG